MRKRVCAALLALLLMGAPACPTALADGPPSPPADSGNMEQQLPVELTPAPSVLSEPGSETPTQPPVTAPSSEPTPEETPTAPPAQETPKPAPGPEGDEPAPGSPTPAPETPPSAPPPEGDGCNTIEALAELLARNEGGTVAVTADLTVPEGGFAALRTEAPVTVDLGPYGITVSAGAFLSLDGPITLAGDGAPRPLLTVCGGLDTVNGPALSARGEHAVAVRLSGGQWYPGAAAVRASGANACAVEAEGSELILYRAELSAEGENSLCIRSDSAVRLILCRAESEGALADAPSLILDGTAASPAPEGARVVRREAGPGDALSENGLCIPVGAAEEELAELLEWRLGDEIRYSLYDSAAEEALIAETAAGRWTGGPVDLSRPGACRFTGTPAESPGGVALPERTVWLYVVDPGKPWLAEAEQGGGGASLLYFREIEGAESVTLWYSVDGGASWLDAAALPGAQVGTDSAFLGALPLENHDYRFQLEVRGGPMAGKSNVLPFACYDDRHWNGAATGTAGTGTTRGSFRPPLRWSRPRSRTAGRRPPPRSPTAGRMIRPHRRPHRRPHPRRSRPPPRRPPLFI